MSKRLKNPPHPDFKLIRGRRGRDVIRINLPCGAVGLVATVVPREVLAAFAEALSRKLAKGRRLARSQGRDTSSADPGDDSPQ